LPRGGELKTRLEVGGKASLNKLEEEEGFSNKEEVQKKDVKRREEGGGGSNKEAARKRVGNWRREKIAS